MKGFWNVFLFKTWHFSSSIRSSANHKPSITLLFRYVPWSMTPPPSLFRLHKGPLTPTEHRLCLGQMSPFHRHGLAGRPSTPIASSGSALPQAPSQPSVAPISPHPSGNPLQPLGLSLWLRRRIRSLQHRSAHWLSVCAKGSSSIGSFAGLHGAVEALTTMAPPSSNIAKDCAFVVWQACTF